MNTALMTERVASPRFLARIAGAFAFLEALTSGFGQVIVPGMLVVSSNAAATAANILAHGALLRFSILAALIGVACHTIWVFLFYELFKPVNRSICLLAAFFGLLAVAIQVFSSLFQAAPLIIIDAGQSFTSFGVEQVQALIFMLVRFSGRAFNIYLAFFGIWCVLIGYLIFRSTFMPRIIGVLEALAGLCWLTFLWPPLGRYLSPYNQVLAAPGELSLMLWLLVMGVNAQKWKEQARRSAELAIERATPSDLIAT
jgi:hypothetical protein